MEFSEANGLWQEIPEWVDFLVRLGFYWPKRATKSRRIALISLPCDSAAAGLVALGAMCKALGDPNANDISQHFQRIRNEPDKILFHRDEGRKTFQIDCEDSYGLWIKEVHGTSNYRRTINAANASRVRFQDEPWVEVITGNQLPYGSIYRELVDKGGHILETNLRQTYSGLCLAGRIMGENKTRGIMADVRFRSDDAAQAGLDQLLSVHDWSREKISRVSFFNSRTKKRDRETARPWLVIADGDQSFFSVLDHRTLFSQSDIIATIDRTIERGRLEVIAQKISDLTQWYVREENVPSEVSCKTRGLSVAIWKKR
jgi:hypothetical protein